MPRILPGADMTSFLSRRRGSGSTLTCRKPILCTSNRDSRKSSSHSRTCLKNYVRMPDMRLPGRIRATPGNIRSAGQTASLRIAGPTSRYSCSREQCILMEWSPLPCTASKCDSGSAKQATQQKGATGMKITTVGLDVAKTIFQIHRVGGQGRVAVRSSSRRVSITSPGACREIWELASTLCQVSSGRC